MTIKEMLTTLAAIVAASVVFLTALCCIVVLAAAMVLPLAWLGSSIADCPRVVLLKQHKEALGEGSWTVQQINLATNRHGEYVASEVTFSSSRGTTTLRYQARNLPFKVGDTVTFTTREIPQLKGGGGCDNLEPPEGWLEVVNK